MEDREIKENDDKENINQYNRSSSNYNSTNFTGKDFHGNSMSGENDAKESSTKETENNTALLSENNNINDNNNANSRETSDCKNEVPVKSRRRSTGIKPEQSSMSLSLNHRTSSISPMANPTPNLLNVHYQPVHRGSTIGKSVREVIGKAVKRTSSLKHLTERGDKEFFSVFNTDKTTRRLTVLHEAPPEEKDAPIDYESLIPMSEKEAIEFTSKELIGRVIRSKYFRYTIMTLIFLTFIQTIVETSKSIERQNYALLTALDQIITCIFVCEILLKWWHGFWKFWSNSFNILDFLIVFGLLIGPRILSSSSNNIIRILRVLRVFRSLREINSIPQLQVIVQAILQSVPDMANIIVLLVIFMLVFSVLGINLFGETVDDFRDLSKAMFSLFVCITQDAWVDILENFNKAGEEVLGSIYLIVFIILGAFIFINLIVAVVVTNLEYAVKDVRKEESESKELVEDLINENEEGDQPVGVNQGNDIPCRVFEKQNPLIIPDLSGLDIRAIENYLLIVAAQEENLRTYKTLLSELRDILNEACELNKSAAMEGVVEERNSNYNKSTGDVQSFMDVSRGEKKQWNERRNSTQGDMLSSLISMEQDKYVDSSTKNSINSVVAEVADRDMMDKLSFVDTDVKQRYFRRRSTAINRHSSIGGRRNSSVN